MGSGQMWGRARGALKDWGLAVNQKGETCRQVLPPLYQLFTNPPNEVGSCGSNE